MGRSFKTKSVSCMPQETLQAVDKRVDSLLNF